MGKFWMQRSGAGAYVVAAGLALAAAGLHWLIEPFTDARSPFLFYLPILTITAAIAGRGPALVVLAIGALNGAELMTPGAGLHLTTSADQVAIAAYLVVGLVLVLFGARVRLIGRRAAEAEYRLRLAQEDTGIGLFEVDFVSKTVSASASMVQLLGRAPTRSPMSLAQWADMLPADEIAKGSRHLKQKLAEGAEGYEREHRIDLPDGRVRWLMSRVHIQRGPDGRALRVRGASVDITRRKETDTLLRQTQDELRQQVADLRRLHEVSSRLIELPTLADQLGLLLDTACEVHQTGRGLVSLFDPRLRRLAIEASTGFDEESLRRLCAAGSGPLACDAAFVQGRRVVVEDIERDPDFEPLREQAQREGIRALHSTPLLSMSGDVIGVLSVHFAQPRLPTPREISLTDIYARKAAVIVERARAASRATQTERRFRVALESSGVPFSVLAPVRDERGAIVDFRWEYLNAAAARVLRQSAPQLIGRRVLDVLPGTWDVPGLFDAYVAVVESGQTRELVLQPASHGIEGWFHIIASPFEGSVAVWFADITERKRHEQALQEADRRKDEFLATLAHELRNPLAPIRQAALISKAANASEAQKRWSHEVIERQVKHMALLLDDLLDVSRITRGMLQLRRAATELKAVIDAAVETARPSIDAKRHRLQIDLPPEPVMVDVDPLRLAQVVANLLTNAAKYTDPNGAIRVAAAHRGDDIAIEVTDNGIGLRPEALGEIFDMFTQVRSAEDRSSGGLGIGLALAKGLVELHGGTISAASEGPGRGSRFSIALPGAAVRQRAATPAGPGEQAAGPRRRVLVADDNRDAADSLAALLRLAGHEVSVTYDGEAALDEYDRWCPDAALLDIGMPRRSGYEVAAEIRARPGGGAVILVAVTGWGQTKDRSTAIAAGFDHHLTKPVDPDKVHELLASPRPIERRAPEGSEAVART
ncbi:ATP-binding protein [Piscinibacter sp. XHJ-5]|uniref:hybrid sensor histidine kinase/response regulator n=1 Tax=Piscinibacter sp. XHJ-5 TaxID=3037797 RepID=UPI002452FDF1|nr:ATP-binding protein [Piscinibacter sp. XHJ-5]